MKEKERTDKQELSILRQCVARLAQMLRVQTILLPVVNKADLANITKLSRTQDRGWNGLCAAIGTKIESMMYADRVVVRGACQIALDYIADNRHTLDDVEKILLAVRGIVPKGAMLHFQHALNEVMEGSGETTAPPHLKLVLKWLNEADGGLADDNYVE